MADARRQSLWEETSAAMAWLARCWLGEKINPNDLNPYVPKRVKSKEERAIESEEGWALLKAGLRAHARTKGKHHGG